MMEETVLVGFPNEGEIKIEIKNVKKWEPTDIKYVGDVVFFNSGNVYLSMRVIDFNKIFNI